MSVYPALNADIDPDKPAYIMAASGEVVTFRELDALSSQAAQLFRSLGIQAGDHIALQMENNRHFMVVVWAAMRSGLIYTAISTHLKTEEVAYIVDNCDARLLVTSKRLAPVVDGLRDHENKVDHYFIVDDERAGYQNWEHALAEQPTTPIDDEQRGIQMLYSSGTTGLPKGVLPPWKPGTPLDEPTALAPLLEMVFGFDSNSVYLSPAPLYHAAPLLYNVGSLSLGATSIIMEQFDAERALSYIDQYRATHSQWVPIMFVRMLKLSEETRASYDTSTMKVAIHAAAPCPVEVKQQMIDWWGPVIYEYYSSTEGTGFTFVDSENWLTHKGTVGVPLNCEVHIVGEDGEDLPVGEVGTVYFGSPLQTFEYYREPEKTAASHNDKGWSTMGDVGYLDEDGYLYLTDRKNFMIITGGVNVYPQEVENLLITHPAVADVAVFGIPNEEFGEEVKAVVQPQNWEGSGPELAEDLIAWCREHLSVVKCPRSLDFMEELPRMDNGKLYKRRLRDAYL